MAGLLKLIREQVLQKNSRQSVAMRTNVLRLESQKMAAALFTQVMMATTDVCTNLSQINPELWKRERFT